MAGAGRTVLVVDDHPLFRGGFAAAWRDQRRDDAVIEAGSYAEAVAVVTQRPVAMVVADVGLPDRSGLELCRWLRSASPRTLAVVLTTHDAPAVVEASRRVGARGFFGKDLAITDLIRDIERLLAVPEATAFPRERRIPELTQREREVLVHLMRGDTNPAIAAHLGLSPETIKTHVGAIFDRFGTDSRFHAVEVARALGFDVALPFLGDEASGT